MVRFFRLVTALLVCACSGPQAAAQFGFGGGDHASSTLYHRVEDGVVRAALEIEIDEGWHLYHTDLGPGIGKPTELELTGSGVTWGELRFPEPERIDQPGLGPGGADTHVLGHHGTIVVWAVGRAASASDDIGVAIQGLTCQDDGSCVLYSQDVTSDGAGSDKLFGDFPADLVASLDESNGGGASDSAKAEYRGESATLSDGHVEATLYARGGPDAVQAVVEFEVDDSWVVYHPDKGTSLFGIPTSIGFDDVDAAVRFPEPKRKDTDDGYNNVHGGTFQVWIAAKGVAPTELAAAVTGMACEDGGSCIRFSTELASAGPGEDKLFAAFPADLVGELAASGSPGSPGSNGTSSGSTDPVGGASGSSSATSYESVTFQEFAPRDEASSHGLAMWLLLAFIAGMILNVMPCVLPVISIKVLSFVQQAGEDRRRILQLGIAFAAGIVIVFWGLAIVAIVANASWGEQFQSAAFLVTMIGIVFAFALSLFGVFEIGVPTQVGSMAGVTREGLGDAFFKGMLATVLATPCSGPFLGSTLTWTLSQTPATILLIFTALGFGMAMPYVVLTANPALLKLLPKPGAWMETFKQAMGFVLLATVVYLMVSLRTDLLLFTAAFLVFVAAGAWWYGRFATFTKPRAVRYGHLAVALAICAVGARVSFVEFRGLFEVHEGDFWVEFDADAFQEDIAMGRNVFVDFTADWCPNCKYNEKFVYESDQVRRLFDDKDVVTYKADITHDGPRTDMLERLLQGLGGRSIPYMAVFPGDEPEAPYVRPDIVTIDDVSGLLEACPD